MKASVRTAASVVGAAFCGAGVAAVYAVVAGLAFNAHSRSWEMGAIPFLLAGVGFVGLLEGVVAGLASRERPYLAAFLATLFLAVVVGAADWWKDLVVPGLGRDARREFWANIDAFFVFGSAPFGVVPALWGALVVDRRPHRRLRWLREQSYGFAGFLAFVALMPPALHWLPPLAALAVSAGAAVAFVIRVARRNREMRNPDPGPEQKA
ncbi:MAG: hypothetical protein ACREQY_07265 [Candidatus Binatia bacterium]